MLENKASKLNAGKKVSEVNHFIKALAGKEKFSKFSFLHQSKNDRRKKIPSF